MAYFESSEQMTEIEERDELQVSKGVLTVNDEVLLSLFDSPVEQTVEEGWEPNCGEASEAFVSVMEFQL